MIRVVAPLTLTLLLLPAASAQETFDLRKLMGRDGAVGEQVRVSEEETGVTEQVVTNKGQVVRQSKEEKAPSQTYVDRVDAVGEDGEPDRVTRTYEAFKDDEGHEVAVAGVVVELTRAAGADGKREFSWAPAGGSAPVPEAVRADLEDNVANKRARDEKGVTEDAMFEALIPAEPQAAGATWTIDMSRAVRVFGLEDSDVDLAQSQGSGSLGEVEERDGQRLVKLTFDLSIMLVQMRGQPLPPTPMTFALTFSVNAAGDRPDGAMTMVQRLDLSFAPQGAPPGMEVSVKVANDKAETRSTP